MDFHEIFKDIIKKRDVSSKLNAPRETVVIPLKDLRTTLESKTSSFEEELELLKKTLSKKPLVVNSGWKRDGEPMMIKITYYQFRGEFELKIILTWSEISESSVLLNDSITYEILNKILGLTQPQSETLIENILSDLRLEWIKDFKLSPTRHDDGGRDFTASILIKENKKEIGFSGFGKMVPAIGQLKHLKSEMGPGAMRDFIGAMKTSKKNYGIVISSRGFTEKALEEAQKSGYKIFCHDSYFLANLMVANGIGMKNVKIKSGKTVDEEWWNEIHLST